MCLPHTRVSLKNKTCSDSTVECKIVQIAHMWTCKAKLLSKGCWKSSVSTAYTTIECPACGRIFHTFAALTKNYHYARTFSLLSRSQKSLHEEDPTAFAGRLWDKAEVWDDFHPSWQEKCVACASEAIQARIAYCALKREAIFVGAMQKPAILSGSSAYFNWEQKIVFQALRTIAVNIFIGPGIFGREDLLDSAQTS